LLIISQQTFWMMADLMIQQQTAKKLHKKKELQIPLLEFTVLGSYITI
jgi:hypothetical protein